VAERRKQAPFVGAFQPGIGSSGNLSERVERLLKPEETDAQPRPPRSGISTLCVIVALLCVSCFLLPGVRVGNSMTTGEAQLELDEGLPQTDSERHIDDGSPPSLKQILLRELADLDREIQMLGADLEAVSTDTRLREAPPDAASRVTRLTSYWTNLKQRRDTLARLTSQID
jgi:hypothetical protein